MPEPPAHRSYLFAPGSSIRILAKVLDAGADAVVLDLEDAVADSEKATARNAVGDLIQRRALTSTSAVHVRVNAADTSYAHSDLDSVAQPGLQGVRLPKCEDADAVRRISNRLTELENARGFPAGSVWIYPTIETAAGVLATRDIARADARVAALVFGPVDFAADVSLPDFTDDDGMMLARSTLVIESRGAGIGRPIDGAFADLQDGTGLHRVASLTRRLGFAGKSAIHPSQLPVLHEVFTPTPDEVGRAEAIVASLEEHTATARVGDTFVDPAVVAQARAVLRTARRANTVMNSDEGKAGP